MPPRVRVLTDATGVDFVGDVGATVRVDVRNHTITLDGPPGPRELGALRAGLLTSMAYVAEALELPPMGKDLTPAAHAIERALARASSVHAGALAPDVVDGIDAIYATPLVHSAAFLGNDAKFVREDARKFRACRIAIACAEDDRIDEDGIDVATAVVERLGNWRALYQAKGASKRAVQSALNDFGDVLDAPVLWGLRKIPLSRARKHVRDIELLGWLGALPHVPDEILAIVERASDDELVSLVADVLVEEPRDLAQLLAEGDPSSKNVKKLLESARDKLVIGDVAYPKPPIALPAIEGVTWIGTPAALKAEGARMHHCVFTRDDLCRHADAFVFHAERDGDTATVQVNRDGSVYEARGPFNRQSLAVRWAATVLADWGLSLWHADLEPAALTWSLGVEPPPGTKPLRNVREIVAAYDGVMRHKRDPGRYLVRDWFRAATKLALRGDVMLSVYGGDLPVVAALHRDGPFLGDSTSLRLERERASPLELDARVVAAAASAWRAPPPPLPLPTLNGVRLLDDAHKLAAIAVRVDVALLEHARPIALGERFVVECRPDRGVVVVGVERDGTATVLVSRDAEPVDVRWALDTVARWTRAFWALRIGLGRSTWSGAMRAPGTAEPLRSVDACVALYSMIAEQHGDRDGRLAAFFEKHVANAVRAQAWIVVRDRAAGSVFVFNKKRNVVDKTDALIGV